MYQYFKLYFKDIKHKKNHILLIIYYIQLFFLYIFFFQFLHKLSIFFYQFNIIFHQFIIILFFLINLKIIHQHHINIFHNL